MKTIASLSVILFMTSCCSMRIPEPIMISGSKGIWKSPPAGGNPFAYREISLRDVPRCARLFLSGEADRNAPLIVDDQIWVNGSKLCDGFTGNPVVTDKDIGKDPSGIYPPIDAFEITKKRQGQGKTMTIGLYDHGVWGCCSPVYLRFVCEDEK